jgi:hypothetical protein
MHMSDQEFQTGLVAALQQASQAYIASSGYAATGLSGTVTYTPPVTATPPAETVTF